MSRKLLIIYGAGAGLIILIIIAILLAPWFLDRTKPVLQVKNLTEQGFYNSDVQVQLSSSDTRGKLAHFCIKLDYQPVLEKKPGVSSLALDYTLPAAGLAEGEHRIDFTATDDSFRKNSTRVSLFFTFDRTAPALEWVSPSQKVLQGDVLPVFIHTPGEKKVQLSGIFMKQKLPFYPVPYRDQLYRALLPVNPLQKRGVYYLNVRAKDGAGNVSSADFPVEVRYKSFPGEVIQLNTEKTTILTDRNAAAVNRDKMNAALSASADIQYWKDEFTRPVQGYVTSLFGTQRIYNTGVVYSYHKGLDLANKQGTPVHSANRGRVVLAEPLPLNGNCVVIDHGQWLFSMYFHMHTILVHPGDVVEKGDQIGTIGTTGISTGPHLHWEMHIGDIAIDPEQWEKGDLGNFNPAPTLPPG